LSLSGFVLSLGGYDEEFENPEYSKKLDYTLRALMGIIPGFPPFLLFC